jgi:hypothetical protein
MECDGAERDTVECGERIRSCLWRDVTTRRKLRVRVRTRVAPCKKEVSPDDWADFNRRQLSSFIITAFQFHDRGLFNPFGRTRPLSFLH